ncbi:hypothetical protein HQ560_21460, partial [bacterium]|nr:hypothetical protein [bacterium]
MVSLKLLLALATSAAAGALPVNTWTPLLLDGPAGYTHSRPLYVPARKQVLHWGAVAIGDVRPWFRNDVRAFDPTKLTWASDYPSAAPLPRLNEKYGKGAYYRGRGEMLPDSRPAPSMIVDAVCWDSKRKQLVYAMPGLMAAYDPATRVWRDLKAKTVLGDETLTGGPPVYGAGMAYDPVHDEIVLFPHWGGRNATLRSITGEMSGHYGTLVYRFDTNTWTQLGDELAAGKARKGRRNLLALLAQISTLADEAWALRHRPDAARTKALAHGLRIIPPVADVLTAILPDAAQDTATAVLEMLGPAADVAAAGRMADVLTTCTRAVALLRSLLDGPLAIEPPPRCGTPLIHDPANGFLVMFGGHDGLVRTDLGQTGHHGGSPGARNDTWLYDLIARQWRQAAGSRRPPQTLWPRMVYDPASGLALLVTWPPSPDRKTPPVVTLWAFDGSTREWTKLHEQPWTWDMGKRPLTGWSAYPFEIAYDPDQRLLLLMQNVWKDKVPREQVFGMRLDLAALTRSAPPEWTPPPPIRPLTVPADDAAWVAKLKALPPNTWVRAEPPREPANRDWGNAACDPVRGWVVFFGGGHATYQVNNVAVYATGANRWVTAAGDHNDWAPPVGWGGAAMGLRGGAHAHHMRNEYVALDGRMFRSTGAESRRWGAETAKRPGPRFAWFHDADRGGVWRQTRIATVARGEGVAGTYGRPCTVHPDGRVFGFGGSLEPYDGRFFESEAYFSVYDIYANTLEVKAVPPPFPGIVYECRPFCTLPDRNQIFFYECAEKKGVVERQGTWLYDVEANRFTKLEPNRHPPGEP